jgi:nitrite reductase/ring-hydroxylating ferredoxin subunit
MNPDPSHSGSLQAPSEQWVHVALFSAIRDGKSMLVRANDVEIALWRIGETIYAINNVCPHQHFSSLHEGTLDGLCVTCPRHGWSFELGTGRAINGNGRAKVYPARIAGDSVYVELPADE